MLVPRIKRHLTSTIVFASFILVLVNEFLIYPLQRLGWSSIQCRSANCTSILLVADPQLLGETFEKHFYSTIAAYDSDNYLRKTFRQAISHTKPNVVCFLGDLLDEGSVASDDAYERYVKRFHGVFQTNSNIQKVHIAGDNDIGGEELDYVTARKLKRFEMGFNETDSTIVSNRIRFFNVNQMTHAYPEYNETTDGAANRMINIVLSHISILSYPGLSMKTILKRFKPKMIFTAHSHYSRLITYPPQHFEKLVDNRVVTIALNNIVQNFTEISSPTCSYRMGVPDVGYGYAVIDDNVLHYTVLWSPNRFKYLISYAVYSIFLLIVLWRSRMLCQRRVTYRFRERLMIATDKF